MKYRTTTGNCWSGASFNAGQIRSEHLNSLPDIPQNMTPRLGKVANLDLIGTSAPISESNFPPCSQVSGTLVRLKPADPSPTADFCGQSAGRISTLWLGLWNSGLTGAGSSVPIANVRGRLCGLASWAPPPLLA